MLDVTPLSLGIETYGGVFTKLVESNTTIPKRASQVFSTAQANQPSVEIHILQGERPMANQNRSIGRFVLDGIPAMRKGEPQIEVTFDIDANGILSVSAKEMTTGKQQSIRIEASTGLSKEEVERMKQEAEENAAADKEAREIADKLNEADSVIYQTERQLEEFGDKVSGEAKADIEKALIQLKEAHQQKDLDGVTAGLEAVNNAWAAATQNMNPGAGAEGAENAGPEFTNTEGQEGVNNGTGNAGDDNVTDVEFEEVDNK